ncbi:MAG: ABC transporter permease/substrate-binding protein [Blastocatellia bacterium]|nr:ABC transporter permease/substrate-binding protein [Blastocatellia bacterium]
MNFLEFLQANWQELLTLTREHIIIVFVSTLLAVVLGVPLGVMLTRIKGLRAPVLGFANVMQTVPSLALFALLIPIPFIGGIGASTAIIALSLYALLPVIRNTFTGITGIDAKLRESATALGMTTWQKLRMIELPLAAPVILTGIRVAVVISVGVATIAAAIGAGGLGTYIFRGLRQNDNNLLLAGAILSALLALTCDFAIGAVARAFEIGNRKSIGRRLGVAAAGLILASVLVSGAITGGGGRSGERIVVASKDFTESVILAEILAQMLEREGITVERQLELGGNIPHDGLLTGSLDVYPEYTGTAYTAILKKPPITDPEIVYNETQQEYSASFGLHLSPPLGFANDFAILVRGNVAREANLRTISDAVPLARNWQAGFGQDFMSRTDGYPGFVKAYGFTFSKQPREMDLALTYRALQAGEVDIIAGNSTDGLIAALDLVQLEDNRRYFPPYQAVFVARQAISTTLKPIFDRLAGAISTEDMRRMNYEVDGRKRTPAEVAGEWVRNN